MLFLHNCFPPVVNRILHVSYFHSLSEEDIEAKVGAYRMKLMGQGKADLPKDEFGRVL